MGEEGRGCRGIDVQNGLVLLSSIPSARCIKYTVVYIVGGALAVNIVLLISLFI